MSKKLSLLDERFSSVQFSCSVVSDSLWLHESQHARPPCPSPAPGVYSNSCPLSRWCHPDERCFGLLWAVFSSSTNLISFCLENMFTSPPNDIWFGFSDGHAFIWWVSSEGSWILPLDDCPLIFFFKFREIMSTLHLSNKQLVWVAMERHWKFQECLGGAISSS